MSSTIYQGEHLAPVIELEKARKRKGEHAAASTLMVRCAVASDEEIYRWVGLDAHATIAECRDIVRTVFNVAGDVGSTEDPEAEIGDILRERGDITHFHWGLWVFEMQLDQIYPRDASAPPSVCIAAAGEFGGAEFDIYTTNAALMGFDRADRLLASVRPEVRSVLGRAKVHDFLPLLHALEVDGEVGAGTWDVDKLKALPCESDQRGRDAFWSVVLARACFTTSSGTDQLIQSLAHSLGYGHHDADTIRSWCAESLAQLREIVGTAAPIEMLDVFAELIRG